MASCWLNCSVVVSGSPNWSMTVVAGLLSVSLSTPASHHGVILFAMLLISVFLLIEARRYRFFDVYRARVRQLERHYFAQALFPQAELKADWAQEIAASLREAPLQIGRLNLRLMLERDINDLDLRAHGLEFG